MKRIVTLACGLSLAGSPPVFAQGTDTPEQALIRSADSLHVGEYCAYARRILAAETVRRSLGSDTVQARVQADIICDDRFERFSLLALTGKGPAPIDAVARLHAGSATP